MPGCALVGSTNPAPSAMLRSSASGHKVTAPYLLAVTRVAPLPAACTRPPLCACITEGAIRCEGPRTDHAILTIQEGAPVVGLSCACYEVQYSIGRCLVSTVAE